MSTFATLPADERSLFFRQYQQTRGIDPVTHAASFTRSARNFGIVSSFSARSRFT